MTDAKQPDDKGGELYEIECVDVGPQTIHVSNKLFEKLEKSREKQARKAAREAARAERAAKKRKPKGGKS